ncbi:sensor histidine kinase [Pseudonocardia lacus]|uniref:sensor histidine kinase n=1 Tax=Pseudonocardia lacus TaxID=2835865 RepID=UPI001BDD45F8|nr:HAMP domain-containing sensor histidine kinase [Pseudonocardia lacus]
MRSRLLVIVLVLVGLLAAGLGVPLALSDAQARQQRLFIDRLTDTISFASLAVRSITDADTAGLRSDMTQYDRVFGIAVIVLDRNEEVVAISRSSRPELDEDAQRRVQLALGGRRSEPYPLLAPWNDQPMVLAEPVLVDGDVAGAVVTVSPTDPMRGQVLLVWAEVLAAGLAALALGVLGALPVVRWILRPVRRLDEGTGRVAAAVLAGKDPDPVADGTGPPELRRLSVSFDRMTATVTQAYAAQRAFVADASHQLRNPLTALRIRLSNLEGHVLPEAVDDHLGALEEAERLSTLLDGLLALARAERTVPVTGIDVDAAVDDRVEAWRPLAEHTELDLVRSGVRGLTASASAGAVETVLDAVLDNAVKFSPPGSTITVHTTVAADRVEVAVRDTGPGIAPEELTWATARFWRSPAQSNVEGSGLGLAIAARTLELGGGELRLELPAGGGLRVVAVLRREPAGLVEVDQPSFSAR